MIINCRKYKIQIFAVHYIAMYLPFNKLKYIKMSIYAQHDLK